MNAIEELEEKLLEHCPPCIEDDIFQLVILSLREVKELDAAIKELKDMHTGYNCITLGKFDHQHLIKESDVPQPAELACDKPGCRFTALFGEGDQCPACWNKQNNEISIGNRCYDSIGILRKVQPQPAEWPELVIKHDYTDAGGAHYYRLYAPHKITHGTKDCDYIFIFHENRLKYMTEMVRCYNAAHAAQSEVEHE